MHNLSIYSNIHIYFPPLKHNIIKGPKAFSRRSRKKKLYRYLPFLTTLQSSETSYQLRFLCL